jgi:hypothetical protein
MLHSISNIHTVLAKRKGEQAYYTTKRHTKQKINITEYFNPYPANVKNMVSS